MANQRLVFLSSLASLLLVDARVRHVRSGVGHRETRKNSPRRSLEDQVDDPCAVDFDDAAFFANEVGLLKPSFFSECATSLKIDADNMIQHIQNLDAIFKQYHCFYDIAKDPSASIPGSFQPELGYSVYGEGGGQADIEGGLEGVLHDVRANGASMATFWDIQPVFNALRDGHVAVPQLQESFTTWRSVFIPERYVGVDSRVTMDTEFELDLNGDLQLLLTFNNTDFEAVETINGLTVGEFMVTLANNPVFQISPQDVGGRVNFLIASGGGFGNTLTSSGQPLDALPDSFLVTYTSGGSETFHAGVLASDIFSSWMFTSEVGEGSFQLIVDRTAAETFINQPGAQYQAYARAKREISNLTSDTVFPFRSAPITHPKAIAKTSTRQSNEVIADTIKGKGGYTIQSDVMVLKFSSFDSVDQFDARGLWVDMVRLAKENDITKLLVDLSSNGGGSITTVYYLLFLMFPSADISWFKNQFDLNYNKPMRLFREVAVPLLESAATKIKACTEEEIQQTIAKFSETDLELFRIASSAMVELCEDSANPLSINDTIFRCEQVKYFEANVTEFLNLPEPTTFGEMFNSLLFTIEDYNPWSVALGGPLAVLIPEIVFGGVRTVIRGGVESNITTTFDLALQFLFDDATTVTDFLEHEFDEIVFVSDGQAASAAAIFPFEASQLYKNSDRSNITQKVTLCAYGGTGNQNDFTIASIPASVQGIHLEDPIIGKAAISLLLEILPDTMQGLDEIVKDAAVYADSIASPPFFATTLPVMPISNYYDNFMAPGALPLQFVKIPLDEYIPKIFTGTSFTDQSSLRELYEDASNFFSPSAPISTPTPPAPTVAPVPTPVVAPVIAPTKALVSNPPSVDSKSSKMKGKMKGSGEAKKTKADKSKKSKKKKGESKKETHKLKKKKTKKTKAKMKGHLY